MARLMFQVLIPVKLPSFDPEYNHKTSPIPNVCCKYVPSLNPRIDPSHILRYSPSSYLDITSMIHDISTSPDSTSITQFKLLLLAKSLPSFMYFLYNIPSSCHNLKGLVGGTGQFQFKS